MKSSEVSQPESHHPAALPVDLFARQCSFRFVRRGGPGGQHRNKVATAVVAVHLPSGLQAEANERRSQAENRSAALTRLRLLTALELRSPWPDTRQRSALWQSRCRDGKIVVNQEHSDFAALLAEALDAVAGARGEMRIAAERLGCTTTQLVRFLQRDPRAFALVQRWRNEWGLPPLH